MAKRKVPETHYRASRICRVLGNPTAYEILHLLKNRERSPQELAHIMGISMPTISLTLRMLRQLDLIRYDVKWRERVYWIKDDMVIDFLTTLESLVKRIKYREY